MASLYKVPSRNIEISLKMPCMAITIILNDQRLASGRWYGVMVALSCVPVHRWGFFMRRSLSLAIILFGCGSAGLGSWYYSVTIPIGIRIDA